MGRLDRRRTGHIPASCKTSGSPSPSGFETSPSMMNGGHTAALSVLALLGCAAASARRGSTAVAGGGGPTGAPPVATEIARAPLGTLTVSKWRLPNGLEVVLLPDPRATSVSYMTWFRVGSRNEDEAAGETGLAHLFE